VSYPTVLYSVLYSWCSQKVKTTALQLRFTGCFQNTGLSLTVSACLLAIIFFIACHTPVAQQHPPQGGVLGTTNKTTMPHHRNSKNTPRTTPRCGRALPLLPPFLRGYCCCFLYCCPCDVLLLMLCLFLLQHPQRHHHSDSSSSAAARGIAPPQLQQQRVVVSRQLRQIVMVHAFAIQPQQQQPLSRRWRGNSRSESSHRWRDGKSKNQHPSSAMIIADHRSTTTTAPFFFLFARHHQQSSVTTLCPEDNPNAQPNALSEISNVRYGTVLDGLHQNHMFPVTDLEGRTALSRTDGYWPFLQDGRNRCPPPQHLTYGEFDFYFFAHLLDRALDRFWREEASRTAVAAAAAEGTVPSAATKTELRDVVFTDLGSGTGRLVFAAAALHPEFQLCRGVELLEGISNSASRRLEDCRRASSSEDDNSTTASFQLVVDDDDTLLPLSSIEFNCGSFDDPYVYYGDSHVLFSFSSCMGGKPMGKLAQGIGRQCRPGTIVINTDHMLPLEGTVPPVEGDERVLSGTYRLRLLESADGYCWLTGGLSTAYIYIVDESLAQPAIAPPVLSVQDICFQVVKAYESGDLTVTEAFVRNVYNNMVFYGLPERFYPKSMIARCDE
jgi:SAM-dependent methyltransferase